MISELNGVTVPFGDRYDKIRVRLIDRNPSFEAKKTAQFLILLEQRRHIDELGLIGKKDRLIKHGVIERGAEIAFRLDLGERQIPWIIAIVIRRTTSDTIWSQTPSRVHFTGTVTD